MVKLVVTEVISLLTGFFFVGMCILMGEELYSFATCMLIFINIVLCYHLVNFSRQIHLNKSLLELGIVIITSIVVCVLGFLASKPIWILIIPFGILSGLITITILSIATIEILKISRGE